VLCVVARISRPQDQERSLQHPRAVDLIWRITHAEVTAVCSRADIQPVVFIAGKAWADRQAHTQNIGMHSPNKSNIRYCELIIINVHIDSKHE